MTIIKKIVYTSSIILTCASFLTACQTVKGTVVGAGKDVRAAERVLDEPVKAAPKKSHHQVKKVSSHSLPSHHQE